MAADSGGFGIATVQAPRAPQVFPDVYLQEELHYLTQPMYYSGVKISRLSALEVQLEVTSGAGVTVVTVRAVGVYLQLSVEVPTSLKPQTSGLLSGTTSHDANAKLQHIVNMAALPALDLCSTAGRPAPATSSPGASIGSIGGTSDNVMGNEIGEASMQQIVEYCAAFKISHACDHLMYFPDVSAQVK